jgi:hypothetical protein
MLRKTRGGAQAAQRADLRKFEEISFPLTAVLILIAFQSIVATAVPTVLAALVLTVTFRILYAISQIAVLSVFAPTLR